MRTTSMSSSMPIDVALPFGDDVALLFDGFDFTAAALDSDAFALAATDLADPSAFFAFASLEDSALLLSPSDALAPVTPLNDDARSDHSDNSSLSHATDSDASGSTSDASDTSASPSPLAQRQPRAAAASVPTPPHSNKTQQPQNKAQSSSRSKKPRTVAPFAPVASTNRQPLEATVTTPPVGPMKRPRKHNRIEILKLRDQVAQLESQLSQLQTPRSLLLQQLVRRDSQEPQAAPSPALYSPVSVSVAAEYARQTHGTELSATTNAPVRSEWLDRAVSQYAQLQHAQTLNRKLRDAVAKQRTVTASFESLLQKNSARHVRSVGLYSCEACALISWAMRQPLTTVLPPPLSLSSRPTSCASC